MDTAPVILSQYHAALAMLQQTVSSCPAALWDDLADQTRFWRIAYHALFYTHLYLSDSEAAFTPWSRHRPESQFIGPLPWTPHALPAIGEPYTPADLLEYLAFCRNHAAERIPRLNLDAPSGFDWLPFNKLELLLYSLRHLQQHTGELMERLGTRHRVQVNWVSTGGA